MSPHRVLGVGGRGDRKGLGMLFGNVRVKLDSLLEILVAVPAVLMVQLKLSRPAHGVAVNPPTEPAPPVSMSLHAVLGEHVLI